MGDIATKGHVFIVIGNAPSRSSFLIVKVIFSIRHVLENNYFCGIKNGKVGRYYLDGIL